jgi:hypothetical protein
MSGLPKLLPSRRWSGVFAQRYTVCMIRRKTKGRSPTQRRRAAPQIEDLIVFSS